MSSVDSKQLIDALLSDNADKFDPVRFAYIRGLATRIESPDHNKNVLLLEKLSKAVAQYQVGLDECRSQTKATLNGIVNDFPSHSQQAQEMFTQCQFKQLKKLELQLRRDLHYQDNLAVLSTLKNTINQSTHKTTQSEVEISFEDQLTRQAQDVLASDEVEVVEQDGLLEQAIELQSMKVFRESIKHVNIDRIIDRAINDYPENPGPHNPHMLAIKSLTQMQQLSPHYLRRFASYIETLLWLEKNATKLSEVKK